MRVKDLLKAAENASPEMLVFCTSNTGEYQYCSVGSAKVRGIRIDEVDYKDDDDETMVFIIDEC